MNAVTIKHLYHATFAKKNKHDEWKPTINTPSVVTFFLKNKNSDLPGPKEIIANKVFLKKAVLTTIIFIVSQQEHLVKG